LDDALPRRGFLALFFFLCLPLFWRFPIRSLLRLWATWSWRDIRTLPLAYTEGFFYLDGLFYEGTGREGHSALLAIQPETGKALRKVALAQEYFGEGIVDWGPYIYEWTWTSQVCFVYERASFRLVKKLSYGGEGWGMTRTGDQIVTSDGSANLGFAIRRRFGWCGQSRFTMGLLW
jgi:glutamine cyclotransferase